MTKFIYPEGELTLKKASYKWFNYDCPDIWTKDGAIIFKYNIGGLYLDYDYKELLYIFVKKSHRAFCKKYGYEVNDDIALLDIIKNY